MPGNALECRQHALSCIALAEQASTLSFKLSLLQLSGTWMMLTAQLESAQASGCIAPQKGVGDDKLLILINRFKGDMEEISASPNIPNGVLDAMMDKSYERLTEAIGQPALTAVSALAAFNLLCEELIGEPKNPDKETNHELCMGTLIKSVKDYIGLTGLK